MRLSHRADLEKSDSKWQELLQGQQLKTTDMYSQEIAALKVGRRE